MSDYTKPGTGAKVQLAIDARIQYLLENVLRRAGRAAGVIMDVNTGEVLAMASVPDYDPNAFIPSISPRALEGIQCQQTACPFHQPRHLRLRPGLHHESPHRHRRRAAGHGQPLVSPATATSPTATTRSAAGSGTKQGPPWHAHPVQGHPAVLQSLFQQTRQHHRLAAMVEGCQMVGFGSRTGIELPGEKPGILPGSRAWRAANPGAVMTPPSPPSLHRPGRHDGHPAPNVRHDRLRRQRRQILPTAYRPQGRLRGRRNPHPDNRNSSSTSSRPASSPPTSNSSARACGWPSTNPAAPPARSGCPTSKSPPKPAPPRRSMPARNPTTPG
jgi:hypothetical protein